MKKTIVKGMALAFVGSLLAAGSAMATLIPYWTLADHTAGADGTANMAISFENASNDNISFGLFTVNDNIDTIVDMATIFTATDSAFYSAVGNFTFDGSNYDLDVTVKNNIGDIVRTVSYDDFGTTFGFYYMRDIVDPDRYIYSDSQFNSNVDLNTMSMTVDYANDEVFVKLLYAGDIKYVTKVSDVAPVPEPATMLLLGTGIAGLAGVARKRKKA